MSSINKFPTFKYSQPEAYHFSHDSVYLAREIFEKHHLQMVASSFQILDLCAGCGVVGMDLIFHQLKEFRFSGEIDFIEIQEIYKDHFEENKQILRSHFPQHGLNMSWIQKNYADIQNHKKYDLIVSNPPYFTKETGILSDNNFKNRCRFFLDAGWIDLILFMKNSLKENGTAYFLVRDELKKKIEKEKYFNTQIPPINFISQIRGTWVAQL